MPDVDRPLSVLLVAGTMPTAGPNKGHGTVVVNGNLTFQSSNFICDGTFIANGTTTVSNHKGLDLEVLRSSFSGTSRVAHR